MKKKIFANSEKEMTNFLKTETIVQVLRLKVNLGVNMMPRMTTEQILASLAKQRWITF